VGEESGDKTSTYDRGVKTRTQERAICPSNSLRCGELGLGAGLDPSRAVGISRTISKALDWGRAGDASGGDET
jgi:hypothetical protein